ncbi:MAG: hypothetical protein E7013_06405 [Alphaproteobacteria bacterium]|nr:hypothetical protein [Alphaproteobacteria bacterium]
MAKLHSESKVYALILMIVLSLGCLFFTSYETFFSQKENHFSDNLEHEILSFEEIRLGVENDIKTELQTMLDSWFGAQKTKVSVRLQMDFSENKEIQEKLDTDNPALSKAHGDDVEYLYAKKTQELLSKGGKIKNLSVAVLLDNPTLPEQTQQKLKRLIEKTVGFDASRGDSLEIINTSFANQPFFSSAVWSNSLIVFTIILLLVLFGVLMTKNAMKAEQIELPQPVLPNFTNPEAYSYQKEDIKNDTTSNTLKNAQNLMEKKPDETLTLLRSWLYQAQGDSHE